MPDQEEVDDAELAQRRERGRLAQRAFRKRQIDTIRELREDNQALRDAIDQISRAAATGPASHARQAELQAAIENAFRVAGLDPSLARSLTESGEEGDEDDGVMAGSSGSQSQSQLGLMMDPSAVDFSLGGPFFSAPPVSSQLALTTQAMDSLYTQQALTQAPLYSRLAVSAPSPPRQTVSSSSGRMSPRMTYGLWFEPDRHIRVVQPPHDIVPYVGDGMRSLASAIYWTGMGFSLNALRTVLNARFRGIVVDPDASSSSGESDDDGDVEQDDDRVFISPSSDLGHIQLRHQPVDDGRLIIGWSDDDSDDNGGDDDKPDEALTRESEKANPAGGQTQAQTQAQPQRTRAATTRPSQSRNPSPRPLPPSASRRRPDGGPRLSPAQKEKRYRRRARQAQRAILQLFGSTLRLITDKDLYDIIHARFVWRNKGWIAGDHPGRDPDLPFRLMAALLRDLDHAVAYGESRLWMRPVEVEAYVQQRMRVTPAGWTPWAEALLGRGTPARIRAMRQLVETVALAGTCFGDGPRWRVDTVEMLIGGWMADVTEVEGTGVWY